MIVAAQAYSNVEAPKLANLLRESDIMMLMTMPYNHYSFFSFFFVFLFTIVLIGFY